MIVNKIFKRAALFFIIFVALKVSEPSNANYVKLINENDKVVNAGILAGSKYVLEGRVLSIESVEGMERHSIQKIATIAVNKWIKGNLKIQKVKLNIGETGDDIFEEEISKDPQCLNEDQLYESCQSAFISFDDCLYSEGFCLGEFLQILSKEDFLFYKKKVAAYSSENGEKLFDEDLEKSLPDAVIKDQVDDELKRIMLAYQGYFIQRPLKHDEKFDLYSNDTANKCVPIDFKINSILRDGGVDSPVKRDGNIVTIMMPISFLAAKDLDSEELQKLKEKYEYQLTDSRTKFLEGSLTRQQFDKLRKEIKASLSFVKSLIGFKSSGFYQKEFILHYRKNTLTKMSCLNLDEGGSFNLWLSDPDRFLEYQRQVIEALNKERGD